MLSICMIVKNEEENLPRLYHSISTLINDKDIELIVVDTGSTDKTKEIVRKYTDKLYDFKWINDFSQARNYSISKASGDYIFILDADDEVYNQSQLLKFIRSKEIYKYNTVEFIVKNVMDKGESEFIQQRIFKREGFKYTGKIHNQPLIRYPIKRFTDTYIKHYGYYNSDMVAEKMKKRTLPLLLEQIQGKLDQNSYVSTLTQLAQTYSILRNPMNAIYYANKQIDVLKNTKLDKNNIIVINLYFQQSASLILGKQLDFLDYVRFALSIWDENPDFYYLLTIFYNKFSKSKYEYYVKKWKYQSEKYKSNKIVLPYEIYNLYKEGSQ